jgi:ABC-type Fe2+-enterobactin transport system substrate-binding protein
MLSLKFETEKLNKQAVVVPTVVVDYSNKRNGALQFQFGWLCGVLYVTVEWDRETAKAQLQK